jgi:uncharacterized Zn-binding protein involved in type VI secretion
MPKIVRIGDTLSTGHGCDGSTTLESSNQNGTVWANGKLIAVKGALTVSHTLPCGDDCCSHTAVLNSGSSSVFINKIPVGGVGDSCDSGTMSSGSPNVFAN